MALDEPKSIKSVTSPQICPPAGRRSGGGWRDGPLGWPEHGVGGVPEGACADAFVHTHASAGFTPQLAACVHALWHIHCARTHPQEHPLPRVLLPATRAQPPPPPNTPPIPQSFFVILSSEIGDKTFFIAAVMVRGGWATGRLVLMLPACACARELSAAASWS